MSRVTAAPAARQLLKEATELWPNRNRASDGILPSAAHTIANPKSGHEQGNAVDLTDDKAAGCDADLIGQLVMESRDPRVLYVICNRRIWSMGRYREGWRRYSGANSHDTHTHFELDPAHRHETHPWLRPLLSSRHRPAERNVVVVRNHVRSLVAPNGGTWHLQADGGIITDTDGAEGPPADYHGSVPGLVAEGRASQPAGAAVDLLPFGGGYRVLWQHMDGAVTNYHFPAT